MRIGYFAFIPNNNFLVAGIVITLPRESILILNILICWFSLFTKDLMKRIVQERLNNLAQLKYLSRWIVFGADLVTAVSVSLFTIILLQYAIGIHVDLGVFVRMVFFSGVASIAAFLVFRPYRGVVRHSTLQELWRLGSASFVKSVLLIMLIFLFGAPKPIKFWILCFFIDSLATGGLMLSLRVILINLYNFILASNNKQQRNLLIYGTTPQSISSVYLNTQAYLNMYKVMGYIIYGSKGKQMSIGGLPVYYVEDKTGLASLIKRNNLDGILFTNPKEAKEEQNRLIRHCEKLNLRTLVMPPMEDLVNGGVKRSIRPVHIEDLLGRDEIKINLQEIADSLEGKVVMVSGAAGSIGSEICRQLARFRIRKLVLLDSAETPMHNLRLELEEKFPELKFMPVIGDVRSESRVDTVYDRHKPQVVFHAAAYKHVPMMEDNVSESIQVNVFGTRTVADLAVKYGAEKFVMISTDKAVNPTNVMGCSKRICEIYVQSLAKKLQKEGGHATQFITTRFGNVLGSNGSVIPRFRDQIQRGGPVTVTHPEIIRYFMTIPEACRLVLEAGSMGNGGEIYIFDMGKPVKIVDLAKRMISLSGRTDVKIEFTGLRHGEKLYEELLNVKELTKPTYHEKIMIATVREYDYDEVKERIQKLIDVSYTYDQMKIVAAVKDIVPEFVSKNSCFEALDKKK